MTPLGSDVDPEVNCKNATESGGDAAGRSGIPDREGEASSLSSTTHLICGQLIDSDEKTRWMSATCTNGSTRSNEPVGSRPHRATTTHLFHVVV